MKKSTIDLGLYGILAISFAIFFDLLAIFICGILSIPPIVNAKENVGFTPMHKVHFTQKGYIQFLRWKLPVPKIQEFTFCLWIKSHDLKYAHSIFSYSKNEQERLIRSWISSNGRSIHLEINGLEIFQRTVDIQEHRWYHICQSWENRMGRYAMWLNGHLKTQGHKEQTIDHVIPDGGDIVLGQEYTDFDKGLEEGIEGVVLGFNLLLNSAFNSLDNDYESASSVIEAPDVQSSSAIRFPLEITAHESDLDTIQVLDDRFVAKRFATSNSEMFQTWRKGTMRGPLSLPSYSLNITNYTRDRKKKLRISREATIIDDIVDSIGEHDLSVELTDIPLGLQLIQLTYVNCQLGRGSPFIGGPLMLISWSRTPVSVFGGAMIKNAGNECGNF